MTTKYKKPKNPGYLLEHLTHRPFADLKDLLKSKRRQERK